jgi:hypothetical protein
MMPQGQIGIVKAGILKSVKAAGVLLGVAVAVLLGIRILAASTERRP